MKKRIILSSVFILISMLWMIKEDPAIPKLPLPPDPNDTQIKSTASNTPANNASENTVISTPVMTPSQPPSSQCENTITQSLDIVPSKLAPPNDPPPNLEDYNYSIKREEKKSIQIVPGITATSGALHIQLDHDHTNEISIKPNHQITYENKF